MKTNDVIERLKIAKKNKGYTLQQLSEISGVTLGTVYKIMSGALHKINADKLEKLAKALDVSVSYLTKGDNFASDDSDYLGLVKIACISPKLKVADCKFNSEEIVRRAITASQSGVKIAVFPELSITGYTCGDLFFQQALRTAALDGLQYIKTQLAAKDVLVIVGMPLTANNGKMYNVAVALYKGEILGVVPKTNLPNYNEFFEKRIFCQPDENTTTIRILDTDVPFGSKILFSNTLHREVCFAIEICEDVWVSNSPSISHAHAGANVILNLSASDESVVKSHFRHNMIEMQSAKTNVAYAYCSSGPDESTSDLVFSAHNIICENGVILDESLPFGSGYAQAEIDVEYIANERAKLDKYHTPDGYVVVDFEMPIGGCTRSYDKMPFVPSDSKVLNARCENALNILAHGLKKRIEHTNCQKLVIGVSGGTDSTLALMTCVNALKLLNRPTSDILAVTMPCFGTTQRTKNNSIALATAVGATVMDIDISASVTQHLKDIEHPLDQTDVTYENAQARERTQVLMDLSNKTNGLVIGTGDMSELALGWATYNGDHMSMYSVNSSVPKTFVKALLRHVANKSKEEVKNVILDVLDTPVSPELLPPSADGTIAQITEDNVGPYDLHDYFLFMIVRKGFTPAKVLKLAQVSFAGQYDKDTIYKWLRKFIWRFFSQQFKRSCTPDGVKIGSVDLSKHALRMPSDACATIWLDQLEKEYKK